MAMISQQIEQFSSGVMSQTQTILMIQTPEQQGSNSKNIVLRLLDPGTKQGSIKLGKNGKVILGVNQNQTQQQNPSEGAKILRKSRQIITANQQAKSRGNPKAKMTSVLKDQYSRPHKTPFYCDHEDCSENFIKNLYKSRQIRSQGPTSIKGSRSVGKPKILSRTVTT